MRGLTPRQRADLMQQFLSDADGGIPGSWLAPHTITREQLDEAMAAEWDDAYARRVTSWVLPLSFTDGVVSVVALGVDTDINVIRTADSSTVTLCIRNGLITNFAGRFDVMDPATRLTLTLHAHDGLVVPSTSFLAFHPETQTTRLVMVLTGRVVGV